MSHERIRARLSTFALKRRARRIPALYGAAGGAIGLALAHDASANAWLLCSLLAVSGWALGRERAAALLDQARLTSACGLSRPALGLRVRIAS